MRAVEDLATCSYTEDAFTELLSRIQSAVRQTVIVFPFSAEYIFPQIDRLNLEGYANLDHWVAELDKKIEGILLQRLKHVAQVWCAEFDRSADDGELRRDPVLSKRRGDKQRGEKVSAVYRTRGMLALMNLVPGGEYGPEAHRA